jgi:hypothetical protein
MLHFFGMLLCNILFFVHGGVFHVFGAPVSQIPKLHLYIHNILGFSIILSLGLLLRFSAKHYKVLAQYDARKKKTSNPQIAVTPDEVVIAGRVSMAALYFSIGFSASIVLFLLYLGFMIPKITGIKMIFVLSVAGFMANLCKEYIRAFIIARKNGIKAIIFSRGNMELIDYRNAIFAHTISEVTAVDVVSPKIPRAFPIKIVFKDGTWYRLDISESATFIKELRKTNKNLIIPKSVRELKPDSMMFGKR